MKAFEKLRAFWSKRQNDAMFYCPLGFYTPSDSRYVSSVITQEFLDELDKRGYDKATFKFSIEPKKGDVRFSDQRPEGMTSDEAWEILKKRQNDE